MASTNKTPQLGLNQWEPGDSVLREDFNADNLKIDALMGQSACVVGRFVGDGKANRVIDVGVKPKFVMLFGLYEARFYLIGFVIGKEFFHISSNNGLGEVLTGKVILTENGFQIVPPSYFNAAGKTSQYIVFY